MDAIDIGSNNNSVRRCEYVISIINEFDVSRGLWLISLFYNYISIITHEIKPFFCELKCRRLLYEHSNTKVAPGIDWTKNQRFTKRLFNSQKNKH